MASMTVPALDPQADQITRLWMSGAIPIRTCTLQPSSTAEARCWAPSRSPPPAHKQAA
jgi:hypothetical protein